MKLGRLLIAVVVLAGLGGALLWSNRSEAAKAKKPPAETAPKILALKEPDINRVEIQKSGGEATVVQKDASGKWSILKPKPLPADSSAVGLVTSAVTDLLSDRMVDPHVSNPASYGLSPAVEQVTFTTKDGKSSKLLLGDDTPTGSGVYAMVEGDPRLFTMTNATKSAFEKTYKDLRDRRLMTFDRDKISRVELTAKHQAMEFGRVNQKDWQILKPRPLRADTFQVDDLVNKLSGANMDPTVPDEDLKKAAASFGSAAPIAVAKVTDASGTQTLEVRKLKDDYYAKSSVVDGVFKVPVDLGEGLDKSLDDFRNKKLFDFAFTDPTRIEVKDGDKTTAFDKSGENWMSSGKQMDTTGVQLLIDKLRDLAATKFVDSGFTKPAVEITVVSNGKTTEKVDIAPAGANFIARRQGDSSLYQIDATAVKDARQAVTDVQTLDAVKKAAVEATQPAASKK